MTSSAQAPQAPFVITILNVKGGVGKTTFALEMAAAAHITGRRTIAIDSDSQGSLARWYQCRSESSLLAGLPVVRASATLGTKKLGEIMRGYDVAIIDGPPRLGDVTKSAALAADVVIVPVRPGPFDAWAAGETMGLLDHADQMRESLGLPPVRRVVVVNAAPPKADIVKFALDAYEGECDVGPLLVGNRVAFATAAMRGESVLTVGRDPKAAKEIRAIWEALLAPVAVAQEERAHVH